MTSVQRKKAARAFAERWAKEPGGEKQQAASFWLELANEVLEMPRPTQNIFFERAN
ncbi:hypothetical protein [Corynebacterium callunae]|uniref:hypothetical protein n=1 Tax=Corynebacterium callunae TaxID=1721 RepID=UPI001FFF9576|nr:hypothetical protein [Corynebacterium callunae]MCK2199664.1 hypothetical protein [Corynebacterium callunae]